MEAGWFAADPLSARKTYRAAVDAEIAALFLVGLGKPGTRLLVALSVIDLLTRAGDLPAVREFAGRRLLTEGAIPEEHRNLLERASGVTAGFADIPIPR